MPSVCFIYLFFCMLSIALRFAFRIKILGTIYARDTHLTWYFFELPFILCPSTDLFSLKQVDRKPYLKSCKSIMAF